MDAATISVILRKERSLGNPILKEEILEHIKNFEQIRVNHLKMVEKTPGHCPYRHGEQIVKYVRAIAKSLGCSKDETALITCAAKFHDIGKIKIDAKLLNKPFPLTQEEYKIVKMHTIHGQEIMAPLSYVSNMIRHHHERWDGTGYPDRLKGEDIPLGSRIIGVIDAFNAMTHQRSYNIVKKREYAIEELKKNAGTQFDPFVVKEFITILNSDWLKKNIDFV